MTDAKSTTCRWGLLGPATIARKFWQSVRLSENGVLRAVASRDESRAASFIANCQSRFPVPECPEAVAGYDSILDRADIDAVYIPLPTGVREEWVIAAARKGKHVLCEKPCAVSNEGMQRMVDACRASGVQFMDNVMFMHSRRLKILKELIGDPQRFGHLRRISTQFSFLAPEEFFVDNIRTSNELEPWGCLGDLGWYNIRIAIWAMQNQMPVAVSGRTTRTGPNGNPAEFVGDLYFNGGVSASVYCSFINGNQQWVHLSGTQGNVFIDDFVLPFFGSASKLQHYQPQFNNSGYDFNYEPHLQQCECEEYSNAHAHSQEVELVREFSRLVHSGKTDSYWPDIAARTQTVMSALLESARVGGKEVPCDGP